MGARERERVRQTEKVIEVDGICFFARLFFGARQIVPHVAYHGTSEESLTGITSTVSQQRGLSVAHR